MYVHMECIGQAMAEMELCVSVLSPAVLQLAYDKSKSMKGICIGLVYAVIGIATMISVGIVALIHKYGQSLYFRNTQRGDVQYFFMVLGSVILVGMLIFHVAACRFKTVLPRSENIPNSRVQRTGNGSNHHPFYGGV